MIGRLILKATIVAVPCAAALSPARAEFFDYALMQRLCRGDVGAAEFRTDAGHRLLAETYRARCRMYLLGQADAVLQANGRRACLPTAATESEVAEALVAGLLSRAEPPPGGVGEVVRDVLRARYGCAA